MRLWVPEGGVSWHSSLFETQGQRKKANLCSPSSFFVARVGSRQGLRTMSFGHLGAWASDAAVLEMPCV